MKKNHSELRSNETGSFFKEIIVNESQIPLHCSNVVGQQNLYLLNDT